MKVAIWEMVLLVAFAVGCGGQGTTLEAACGNGTLDPGEQCDDGNAINTDGCTALCGNARCGDGLIFLGIEECDDGNAEGGDGCSAFCQLESGADADAHADADADAVADADADGDADADPDADADRDGDADDGDECVPGCDGGPCGAGEWATICPGTFLMGSPPEEPTRDGRVETQHLVTLTHRFEILSTEVTETDFQARMGYDPSSSTSCGANCPVEWVNWHQAVAYCNALSVAAGLANCYTCSGSGAAVTCEPSTGYATPYECPGYRLPTEAEWEYAARAGTTGGTYNGTCDDAHTRCEQPNAVLDSIAWFCGNSGDVKHPVGSQRPNAWGLYDVLGNVWEWCGDWWDNSNYPTGSATDPWGLSSGSSRALRGMGFHSDASGLRAAFRYLKVPGEAVFDLGIRPARTLP